ncbi:MAG TPA: outer membrane lipoprotein-sorting protein [Papillibacter sp.]|nr:outer membrane lipoprotein-sorting protein [Papillibacter sp.]
MKQAIALALMIALLLPLSACRISDRGAENLSRSVREQVKNANSISLSVDIRADYVDRVYDFSLSFAGDGASGEVTITAPESIAGLKAHTSESGTRLEYDGVFLDTGPLTWDGLSPADAVPLLLDQWREGYISNTSYEKLEDVDTFVIATDVSDSITQRTWFDKKSLLPLRAELSENGRLVLTCNFTHASFDAASQQEG